MFPGGAEPEETPVDVGAWLRELDLEQYEAAFRANGVSGKDLPHLTAEDLEGLGVTAIGHRRRLLVAIEALRLKRMPAGDRVPSSPGPPIDHSTQPEVSETTAERRPLSVMFCDLIGSTALSARLDPEICGRSSAAIRPASPPPSSGSTALSPAMSVTAC